MDILQEIVTNTGIPLAELKRIRKEGAKARKEMVKHGCTESQIKRGMLRILDEVFDTKRTKGWN